MKKTVKILRYSYFNMHFLKTKSKFLAISNSGGIFPPFTSFLTIYSEVDVTLALARKKYIHLTFAKFLHSI